MPASPARLRALLLLGALPALAACRVSPVGDAPPSTFPSVVEVRPLETRPAAGSHRLDPDLLFEDDLAVLVIGATEISTYPWPDHVTAAERRRIDDAIRSALDVGGAEGRDAELYLVALDRDAPARSMKAAGRLITEMKRRLDAEEVGTPEANARLMVLDRILRRIDGVQERRIGDLQGIRISTPPDRVEEVVRIWNWWYRYERHHHRYLPWDPRGS